MGNAKTENNKVSAFLNGGSIRSFISDNNNKINVINNAILDKEKD